MKKYLALCAASLWLCSSPLFCQEADAGGFSADFSLVPVLDGGYAVPMGKSERTAYFDLGNTSLYTLFEGTLARKLNFSISNHWASLGLSDGKFDPEYFTDLYKYTAHSDWNTWLDWAWLEYSFGNFSLRAGKDLLFVEGMEGDEYDWDVHPMLASSFWNYMPAYQWGGSLAWHNDSENTQLALQLSSSPYGEWPFSGPISCGFKWNGEYGPVRGIWSFSCIGTGDGWYPLLSLGQSFYLSDSFTLSLDYWNSSCDPENLLMKGHTAYMTLFWTPSETLELQVKGGAEVQEWSMNGEVFPRYMGGCALHWFPAEGLRLHLGLAANEILDGYYYASIGLQYNLNFHLGK